MNVPAVARGIEELANGTNFPPSSYLPNLGPSTIAPARAAAPPAPVSYTHLTLPTILRV